MGMKKTLTRIFSKKSKDIPSFNNATNGISPPAVPTQKRDVPVINGNRGGLKDGEQRREPLSGLDKLNVVLNPPKPDPQRALSGGKTRATTREARAATKIQAAYRGHLVRRSVRTHKSLVKVQALVRGHIVRRQAAITLRCMNALVRVQARARANAVRKSAAGMEVQQRLEAVGYRQKDGPGKKRSDGWVSSSAPISELEADYHRRQTGFIKRERARAYAASFQNWKNEPAPKTVTYIPNDPDHEGWGWGWLERWMVARPWRNRSFIDATDLTRKDWAPPRKVVSFNGEYGGPNSRRLSESGAFPAKVVEREEPNLGKDLGEQRACKWCGRLSARVKDTEAGPLCGVCQLNTATATRLNKDPYAQTGTKVDSPTASGSRTKSVPSPLSLPRKTATPSPTAAKAERRQSFPPSPRMAASSPGGTPLAPSSSTPKSVISPMGTPRFMQPTQSSLPKFRTSTGTPSPRLKATPSLDRSTPKQLAYEGDAPSLAHASTPANGRHDRSPEPQPANLGEHDAARSHLESASTVPDEWTGATEAQTPTSGLATREAEPIDQPMDGAHAASEVDVDAAMAASEHSQGASKAVPHPESPSGGWLSSTKAPVVAQ